MTAEKPTEDNLEALKIKSWEEVLEIFRVDALQVYGKDAEVFLEITKTLIQRGMNKEFFASQSHSRLVLESDKDYYHPHVMATLNQSGNIEVEIWHLHPVGHQILRRQVCSPNEAASVIEDFAKELGRMGELRDE